MYENKISFSKSFQTKSFVFTICFTGQINLSAMKNNLKVERAIRNITQEELAKQIEVTRQAINSIELNKYVPSTILALKLSQYFNKTVNELFSLEESD